MDSARIGIKTPKSFAGKNARATIPSQSDYFPWQRTVREESRQSGSLFSIKSGTQRRPFSVASVRTACSSTCRHSWNKKSSPVAPIVLNNYEEDKKKQKVLSVLKMQVKMNRISLSDHRKRYQELMKINTRLKEEITSSEDQIHGEAKSLLQRYEKFKGAIGSLHKQYTSQLTMCRKDFEETKQRILKDIKEFQAQVDGLNERLAAENTELKTLLNYKDKEYPGKVLYIAKLKRQRERLTVAHEEEMEELCNTMDAGRQRDAAKEEDLDRNIRYSINEEAIDSMNTNVKEMALQNVIMSKEIEIHKNEILLLEDHNLRQEKDIRVILGDEKLNPAEQLFPDIFQVKPKCFPEDEVQLNIPVQTWLPI